jgi:hypothetical protein
MPIKNAKYLTETDVLSRLVNSDYWVYAYESGGIFWRLFSSIFETPKLF